MSTVLKSLRMSRGLTSGISVSACTCCSASRRCTACTPTHMLTLERTNTQLLQLASLVYKTLVFASKWFWCCTSIDYFCLLAAMLLHCGFRGGLQAGMVLLQVFMYTHQIVSWETLGMRWAVLGSQSLASSWPGNLSILHLLRERSWQQI